MTQNPIKTLENNASCNSFTNPEVVEHPKNTQDGSYQGSYQDIKELPQVQAFFARCDEQKRAKDAYDAVVQDLIAKVWEKAFSRTRDDKKDAYLDLVDAAIRLAWNCAKNYEGVEGFRSIMERKLIKAIDDAAKFRPT